jgi:hypothetical protein
MLIILFLKQGFALKELEKKNTSSLSWEAPYNTTMGVYFNQI